MNGAVLLGFGLWVGRRRAWVGAVFFSRFAGDGCSLVDLEPQSATHPRRLRIEIIVIGFGDPFAKIEGIIPAMLVQIAEFQVWVCCGYGSVLALLGWRALARPYVLALWILLGMQLMVYALHTV